MNHRHLNYFILTINTILLKGGGYPDYYVKLKFEIAVDQQTRARDQTFEGVPDCPVMPAGQPRPYLVNFWLNFAKSPKHAQNHALGCSTCSY